MGEAGREVPREREGRADGLAFMACIFYVLVREVIRSTNIACLVFLGTVSVNNSSGTQTPAQSLLNTAKINNRFAALRRIIIIIIIIIISLAYRPVVDDSGTEGGVAGHRSVHRILCELHAVDLVKRCRLDGPDKKKKKEKEQERKKETHKVKLYVTPPTRGRHVNHTHAPRPTSPVHNPEHTRWTLLCRSRQERHKHDMMQRD